MGIINTKNENVFYKKSDSSRPALGQLSANSMVDYLKDIWTVEIPDIVRSGQF